MPDKIGFSLSGDREIIAALRGIPPELRERAIPQALRFAGRPIVSAARRLAPRDTGLLRKSLGLILRRPRRRKGGDSYLVIGVRTGFGQTVSRGGRSRYADPSKYAHLVEFGHYIVAPVKGARRRQGSARALLFVLARPFLRPAFSGSVAAVRARLIQYLRTYLERRARRAATRARKAA